MYSYGAHLRATKTAATKVSSFLKALTMISFLLVLPNMVVTLRSPRIGGVSFAQLLRTRITKGMSPFTVAQVAFLQVGATAADNEVDQLMSGMGALMVAMRLRFADAQRAVNEPTLHLDETGWSLWN